MSLVYSSTTNKNGIIQGIERTLFGDSGDGRISGNTTLLAMFTAEVNMALDRAFHIIFKADGTWQFDDSNHTDYPIITTDLVANQRDYTFVNDGSSNLILAIQKVAILPSATATRFIELDPADAQSDEYSTFVEGGDTGVPSCYDKTANGIFLDPKPSYNVTAGLKLYISREGSYFATSDTTKKPGFAGLYHEYLIVAPAYKYAYRNNLANTASLRDEMFRLEKEMTEFYGRRNQDERKVMKPKPILYV